MCCQNVVDLFSNLAHDFRFIRVNHLAVIEFRIPYASEVREGVHFVEVMSAVADLFDNVHGQCFVVDFNPLRVSAELIDHFIGQNNHGRGDAVAVIQNTDIVNNIGFTQDGREEFHLDFRYRLRINGFGVRTAGCTEEWQLVVVCQFGGGSHRQVKFRCAVGANRSCQRQLA